MLSTRSVITATSRRDQQGEYRVIGRGTAGTVLEVPGTEQAIKKGSNTEALWNGFSLTNRVHKAFKTTRRILQEAFPDHVMPRTPSCTQFWLPDCKEFWDANGEHFPEPDRSPSTAFMVDRVRSLPHQVREELIDTYFEDDPKIEEAAKASEENKHCLVRVYLGERENGAQLDRCYDSLQNFPMRLKMIEQYVLDKEVLATEMAIALAVIH